MRLSILSITLCPDVEYWMIIPAGFIEIFSQAIELFSLSGGLEFSSKFRFE